MNDLLTYTIYDLCDLVTRINITKTCKQVYEQASTRYDYKWKISNAKLVRRDITHAGRLDQFDILWSLLCGHDGHHAVKLAMKIFASLVGMKILRDMPGHPGCNLNVVFSGTAYMEQKYLYYSHQIINMWTIPKLTKYEDNVNNELFVPYLCDFVEVQSKVNIPGWEFCQYYDQDTVIQKRTRHYHAMRNAYLKYTETGEVHPDHRHAENRISSSCACHACNAPIQYNGDGKVVWNVVANLISDMNIHVPITGLLRNMHETVRIKFIRHASDKVAVKLLNIDMTAAEKFADSDIYGYRQFVSRNFYSYDMLYAMGITLHNNYFMEMLLRKVINNTTILPGHILDNIAGNKNVLKYIFQTWTYEQIGIFVGWRHDIIKIFLKRFFDISKHYSKGEIIQLAMCGSFKKAIILYKLTNDVKILKWRMLTRNHNDEELKILTDLIGPINMGRIKENRYYNFRKHGPNKISHMYYPYTLVQMKRIREINMKTKWGRKILSKKGKIDMQEYM